MYYKIMSLREQDSEIQVSLFKALQILEDQNNLCFQKTQGRVEISGMNNALFIEGEKPALHDSLYSFSKQIAQRILNNFLNEFELHLVADFDDDFAPVFKSQNEQLGFIILELIKNAIVHGNKMHLEYPVQLEWKLDRTSSSLKVNVVDKAVEDNSLLNAIPIEDLRFKWRLGGLKRATRFIRTMTRGTGINVEKNTERGTVASVNVKLKRAYKAVFR